jgi:hypothetical protein
LFEDLNDIFQDVFRTGPKNDNHNNNNSVQIKQKNRIENEKFVAKSKSDN